MSSSPPVGEDEDDRHVRQLQDGLHQLDAVGVGQHQVQQDQLGPLLLHEGQGLLRVPGHHRLVARPGQGVAEVAQRLGVVVHRQHPHPFRRLPPMAPR